MLSKHVQYVADPVVHLYGSFMALEQQITHVYPGVAISLSVIKLLIFQHTDGQIDNS